MSDQHWPQGRRPSQWLVRDGGRAIASVPDTRNQFGPAVTKLANVEQALNEALASGVL